MAPKRKSSLPVLRADLQVAFYYRLQEVRRLYLHDALKATVEKLDLRKVDDDLAEHVSPLPLSKVASFGLRGEVFFPVPCVIEANPFLLGYYRLLFGLSQKELYNKAPFARFKRLEERGDIPTRLQDETIPLCQSLIRTAEMLVDGLDEISLCICRDLQLLTIGPQLRGSQNTKLGHDATRDVFGLIGRLAAAYIKETTARTMRIENDSGRTVMVEFFSDPDVRITEKLPSGVRPLVSMEIKGGTDVSNVHNRIGEAEKSHQKAKNLGFFEFWTILRVPVAPEVARKESPTTTHFFHLDNIMAPGHPEARKFRELLGSLMGIRVST
jgi:hypothetical protein